jgi:oligosaccharide repeat unit polymerase
MAFVVDSVSAGGEAAGQKPVVMAGLSLGEWSQLPLGVFAVGCVASLAFAILAGGFDLNLNRFLLALSMGLLVPFLAHQVKHVGIFSPGVLVGIAFFHYNLLIPIEFEIHPYMPEAAALLMPDFSRTVLERPVMAAFCGVIGLLAGFALGLMPRREFVSTYWGRSADIDRLRRGGWIMLALGGAIYFAGITLLTGSPVGLYTVSYLERSQLETELGLFNLGLDFLFVGGIVVVATALGDDAAPALRRRRALLGACVTAAFALHSVFAGAKLHLFVIGMAALAAWEQRERRVGTFSLKRPVLLVAVGLVAGVLMVIGPMRTALGLGIQEMAGMAVRMFDPQLVNPANMDTYGPYATLIDITNDRVLHGPTYGESYVTAALSVLPGKLVPDRQPQLHHRYARAVLPPHAGDNEGYGFSHLAEGYLAFGYFGVLLQMGLLGWIAGSVSRVLRQARRSPRALALVAMVVPWMFLSSRIGWDGLTRDVVLVMFGPFLVVDWLAVRAARDAAAAPGAGAQS